jgi:hypothetical protein
MRKLIVVLGALLLAVLFAGQASAKYMTWHGTLFLKLGAYAKTGPDALILDGGSGVATINNSAGGAHLNTMTIHLPNRTDSDVWVVTDPNSTPQIKSIIVTGSLGVGQSQKIRWTGMSTPSGGGPQILPTGGYTRLCLFVPGCAANIAMNNTYNATRGVGIGGTITMGGNGSVRVSVEGAPWSFHTVTQVNQTVKGNFITLSRRGWRHGPGSLSSSTTAQTSGVINKVQAATVKTAGITGNSQNVSLFIDLRLHFIPEPGLLLLLGSGVVGLAVLGRSRLKR